MKLNETFVAARTAFVLAICLGGAGFGIAGCQNTAEGVAQDTKKDAMAVGGAADKAADQTKMAAGNAGDAVTLTPKVKSAIIADAKLNDPKNLIDVDTKDGMVYLKGHVGSNDLKKLAGDIATKTVTESGSKDTVMNQLTVGAH